MLTNPSAIPAPKDARACTGPDDLLTGVAASNRVALESSLAMLADRS